MGWPQQRASRCDQPRLQPFDLRAACSLLRQAAYTRRARSLAIAMQNGSNSGHARRDTHEDPMAPRVRLSHGTLSWLPRALLSLLVLAFVLAGADRAQLWASAVSADRRLILLSVALFWPLQLLGAYRWHFLLGELGFAVPFWSLARHSVLGQFSSLFLPGQISGDVVRALAVARGRDNGVSYALTVVVDKAALLTAKAFLVVMGTACSDRLGALTGVRWAAIGLLALAGPLLFALCRYRRDGVPPALASIGGRLPLAASPVLRLSQWLQVPRLPYGTIWRVLGVALIYQLAEGVGGFVVARAFHIPIAFLDWAAVSAAVSVVLALPITVGGLGVRDGVFYTLLARYGVPREQAVAFSLASFVLLAVLTGSAWFVLDLVHARQAVDADEGVRSDRDVGRTRLGS